MAQLNLSLHTLKHISKFEQNYLVCISCSHYMTVREHTYHYWKSSIMIIHLVKKNIPGFASSWLFPEIAVLLSAVPSFSFHVHCTNSQYPSEANSTDHAKKKINQIRQYSSIKFMEMMLQERWASSSSFLFSIVPSVSVLYIISHCLFALLHTQYFHTFWFS